MIVVSVRKAHIAWIPILVFLLLPGCDLLPLSSTSESDIPVAQPTISEGSGNTLSDTPGSPLLSTIDTQGAATAQFPNLETFTNGEAGKACFGSFGEGVTCLTSDGQWQAYRQENSALSGNLIHDITVCPDGSFLFAHTHGISQLLDDGTWINYEKDWGVSSPDAIACNEDTIWIAHFRGASRYHDNKWTTFPSSLLAVGEAETGLVKDIAITEDNSVWVATANSLALFEDETWTIFQEGQGLDKKYFFSAIEVGGNGSLWAAHSSGLLEIQANRFQNHKKLGLSTVNDIEIDLEGNIWLATTSCGLVYFSDQQWDIFNHDNSPLLTESIQSLKTDLQGRLWIGTEYGLSIVEGAVWQSFYMHNSGLQDNTIDRIDLSQSGPVTPDPADLADGYIAGHVEFEEGIPIADARISICVEKPYTYDIYPCENQPFISETITDQNGNFMSAELPVGLYIITLEINGVWVELSTDYGTINRIPVSEGHVTNLPDLYLSSK
jgi:hypothetical protein